MTQTLQCPTPSAPQPAGAAGGFDSDAWNKARADVVKKSRDAGNVHLGTLQGLVDSMRGNEIFYVSAPSVQLDISTVDNLGNAVSK